MARHFCFSLLIEPSNVSLDTIFEHKTLNFIILFKFQLSFFKRQENKIYITYDLRSRLLVISCLDKNDCSFLQRTDSFSFLIYDNSTTLTTYVSPLVSRSIVVTLIRFVTDSFLFLIDDINTTLMTYQSDTGSYW